MNNRNLDFDRQNEFASKAMFILEIVRNLLVFLNNPSLKEDAKQKDYKVQIIFNADELKKYADALNPYQENEKVRAFFDGYNRIKENLEETVKRVSTKEILKDVKKLHAIIEEQAREMQIKKLVSDLQKEYGVSENEIKLLNISKKKPFNVYVEYFLMFVLTSVLMFSLTGLISWTNLSENLWNVLYFSMYYSLLESISRLCFNLTLKKYILKTFGLILVIPMIIALTVACLLPIFVEINSIFMFVLCTISVHIIRKFIFSYLIEKIFFKKRLNKKGEK